MDWLRVEEGSGKALFKAFFKAAPVTLLAAEGFLIVEEQSGG